MPKVKFSPLVKQWLVYVGLSKISSETAIWIDFFLLYLFFDFLKSITIYNILASVAQLTRFDNPPTKAFLAKFVVLSQKGQILFIFETTCDMESKWKILFLTLFEAKVCLHGPIKCFFVADNSAEFEVVGYLMIYSLSWHIFNKSLMHVFISLLFYSSPTRNV